MGMHFAQHGVKHTAQLTVMQAAYDARMQTDDDLASRIRPYRMARRANLIRLIEEAGGASQLARLCDTPKSHISAMSHGARNVGDDLASKLESVMEKPAGWLDTQHDGEAVAAPLRPLTIGQAALALGAAVTELPEPRRKTISMLVAAQIADKPDPQEAEAIDALTTGIAVGPTAPSLNEWRRAAFHLAEKHPDPQERERLTAFVQTVDLFIKGSNSPAGATERSRAARLIIDEGV